MLDHISLLPPEYFEIKRRQSRNKKLLIVFGSLFVITLTVFIILTIIVSGVQSELDITEERLSYVQEKTKEHEEYEDLQKEIELMDQILTESIGLNPGLPSIIKEVGKTVPEEVAVVTIQAKYDYDKGRGEEKEGEDKESKDKDGEKDEENENEDKNKNKDKENKDEKISPGKAVISVKSALYGSPTVLSYWADQVREINKIRDVQYRYMPSSEPDELGRSYQQVEMNILIEIDEPYRYFGGDNNE